MIFLLTFNIIAYLSHEENNKNGNLQCGPDDLVIPICLQMWSCLDDRVSNSIDQNKENDSKNSFFHF